MIDVNTNRTNHDQDIKTEIGSFQVKQRNIGYAVNDGAWIVHQNADLYWDLGGYLTKRRDSKLLGVFATVEEANEAIRAAEVQPELKPHVVLSGR